MVAEPGLIVLNAQCSIILQHGRGRGFQNKQASQWEQGLVIALSLNKSHLYQSKR